MISLTLEASGKIQQMLQRRGHGEGIKIGVKTTAKAVSELSNEKKK